jgi:hypothetical protein
VPNAEFHVMMSLPDANPSKAHLLRSQSEAGVHVSQKWGG